MMGGVPTTGCDCAISRPAADAFIIGVIMLCVVALPGYSTNSPMPIMALWRIATTAIGVAVEVIVATLVFPVTAR